MPRSIKEVATRHREGIVESKIARLETTARDLALSTPAKPRKNTKMQELMEEIYAHYTGLPPGTRRIPATEFSYLAEMYAPKTRVNAREKLGIKSVRKHDRWYWTFPRFSPNEAMDPVHQQMMKEMGQLKDEIGMASRQSAKTLSELMRDSGLFAQRDMIVDTMKDRGYGMSTINKVKASLGIATYKENGTAYWVWGNEDVQRWLEEYLADQQIIVSQTYKDALVEKGWHEKVILMAAHALGGISYKLFPTPHGNRLHWYNVNAVRDTTSATSKGEIMENRKGYTIRRPAVEMASSIKSMAVEREPRTERDEYAPSKMRNQRSRPRIEQEVDDRIIRVDFSDDTAEVKYLRRFDEEGIDFSDTETSTIEPVSGVKITQFE